jgi:choline dehydrogenase-like flavoprotein
VLNGAGVHDLAITSVSGSIDTEVCILGTGPVGLTLARALLLRGVRVTMVDRGGYQAESPAADGGIGFDRRVYQGALAGRAVGLGGTSTLWGGQLLPVRSADLLARPQVGAPAWPLSYGAIHQSLGEVQRMLELPETPFECGPEVYRQPVPALNFTDWQPRLSKWLPFGRRNLAAAWSAWLGRRPGLSIWLNCSGQEWSFEGPRGTRAVAELRVRAPGGDSLVIHPKCVVVACGALESPRLLVEMAETAGGFDAGADALVGRYLHDHLSVRIARIRPKDIRAFAARLGPHFDGPIMRSLRMEPSPEVLTRDNLPALYTHVVAETVGDSGFAVVRDCLRHLQQGNWTSLLGDAACLPRAAPGIFGLLYGRYVEHRLRYPVNTDYYLHVDFEQAPQYDSRVYLEPDAAAGRRRMRIDWDWDARLPEVAAKTQRLMKTFWLRNGLERIAGLEFLEFDDLESSSVANAYDIYHPAGTTRMGTNPDASVVDGDLRVHGTRNVFVAGASVFPSLGAANPTLTAMALACRLAEHLRGWLAGAQ